MIHPDLRHVGRSLAACLLAVGLTSGGREAPPFTLVLAGDINLARGAARAQDQHWPDTFGAVREVFQGDLVLANLESPLTDQPKVTAGIDLRAPLAAVQALTPFTHLSVENNHALDGGERGQHQNMLLLRAQQLTPVTRQPVVQSFRGLNVALLSYLDDGSPPPLAQVQAARQQAHIVIVMPHWGAEYNAVTTRQRTQARLLAQAGATLIVGSGPHVLQGHERIGDTLVLYSLGNLLFDQPYPEAWLGAVVRVQFRGAQVGGTQVKGTQLSACAVPTLTRSGRVALAQGLNFQKALSRLNLQSCPKQGRM
ncbi:CapA family protein [Deinococcus sp. Arct2-2]|uniref:CapA family protein n=1 Tax=Deinococcus sp. Arct2-2 TaxID=2568653 RepID=UPI0010A39CB8|nr:CapA family protein [Deinococcus sp. Arct2-2]THF70359.1 CapA family protein [Deinococcus sp. Arct2-2]